MEMYLIFKPYRTERMMTFAELKDVESSLYDVVLTYSKDQVNSHLKSGCKCFTFPLMKEITSTEIILN